MGNPNLVFVAGASPQIITETVSALIDQGQRPDGVHVLTTETGRALISERLFGRRGQWERLLQHYPQARRCRFTLRRVHVLRDGSKNSLKDVRSRVDNDAAAEQIVRFVQEHTRDASPPLYASIAGGRKTMGYLLAAAMMIHGRKDDRLSHVLVDPPELEGTDFFFKPRRGPSSLTFQRPDRSVVRVRLEQIRVDLADLPFLRLRALYDPAQLWTGSFVELVDQLQRDLDVVANPAVTISTDANVLLCGGRPVKLTPVQLGIYELLAERRRSGCAATVCEGCDRCFVASDQIPATFQQQLSERMRRRQSSGVSEGRWTEKNFLPEVAKINARLARVLRSASGAYEVKRKGLRRQCRYGIQLPAHAIQIVAG